MGVVAFNGSPREKGNTSILLNILISQMIIPGSSHRNMASDKNSGDVSSDEEGIGTMKTLGRNMAWLQKKSTHRGLQ